MLRRLMRALMVVAVVVVIGVLAMAQHRGAAFFKDRAQLHSTVEKTLNAETSVLRTEVRDVLEAFPSVTEFDRGKWSADSPEEYLTYAPRRIRTHVNATHMESGGERMGPQEVLDAIYADPALKPLYERLVRWHDLHQLEQRILLQNSWDDLSRLQDRFKELRGEPTP